MTKALRLLVYVGDKHANVVEAYINGRYYEYRPKGYSAEECVRKIEQMQRHSSGKALVWLRKHCEFIGKVEEALTKKEEPKKEKEPVQLCLDL